MLGGLTNKYQKQIWAYNRTTSSCENMVLRVAREREQAFCTLANVGHGSDKCKVQCHLILPDTGQLYDTGKLRTMEVL